MRGRLLTPALTGLLGTLLVLWVTEPASHRELALDDVPHLHDYPALNASRSLPEIFALRHWQHIADDGLWRPVPKMMWSVIGVTESGSTGHLWFLTGLLAGLCAGLFAMCLGDRRHAMLRVIAPLTVILSPLAADVLLPFVGQADLLAALGVMGAWACWSNGGWGRAALGGALLAVALLSKESALPAVLALPLALWLGEGSRSQRRRRALRALGIGVLLLAARLGSQVALQGGMAPALGAAGRVAEGERSVGTLEILGRHASGLLFPTCPQTDHSFLKQPGSEGGLYPLFGGGALALWIAALIWALRREHASKSHARGMRGRRRLASALLWMALLSLPSLHLIPIGALWAGRFLFLPLIGFSLAVVALSDLLPRPLRWVPMLWLLALVVAGTVSIRDRAFDWVSPRTLWEAEVARHPEHAFAWKNLAVCLQRDGETEEALVAARRATALWPQFGEGWLARGQIARALDLEEEAASALAEAERLLPDDATVQIERAKLEALQGRFEEAEGRLERLLERQPGHAEARDLLDLIRRDPRRR